MCSTKTSECVSEIRDSVLKSFDYSLERRCLHLTFEHWDGKFWSVELSGVLQLNVSNTDGNSTYPLVLNAVVQHLEDGGKQILAASGYMWRDLKGNVKSYPGMPLTYFLIEGDICLGVVCENFKLEKTH